MQNDMKLKKEDIEIDYYKAIARFENLKRMIINLKELEIKPNDSEELKLIKKSQYEELLVDLGRVGELAFKYLLKVKQLEMFPKQSYEEFSKNALFHKGPLKDFAQKNKIPLTEIEPILSFGAKQKEHNFTYLCMVLEKTLEEVYNNFKHLVEYKLESDEIIKLINSSNNKKSDIKYYLPTAIFPELLWVSNVEIPQDKIQELINIHQNIEQTAGDIFTRFRYFSENLNKKEFNLKEVYNYIELLVLFIKGIHDNNNDLKTSPSMILGRLNAKKYSYLIGRTEQEIDLFFNKFINNNIIDIEKVLFNTTYSIDDAIKMEKILKRYNITYNYGIYHDSILPEELEFFLEHGIADNNIMLQILYFENGKKLSITEIKEILKQIEFDKYDNLCLVGILTIDEILELNKYEKLENFILENYHYVFVLMLKDIQYKLPYDLKKLLSIEQIHTNPELLHSLDYQQINISRKISKNLLSDDKYKILVRNNNFDETTIINNIKENIKRFGNNPNLIYSIPLMLNQEEINSILDLLKENGLDINNLSNFNSTILCMPYNYVKMIIEYMKENNIQVIINNNISKEFTKISDEIMVKIINKTKTKSTYYSPFRTRPKDNPDLRKEYFDTIKIRRIKIK